MPAVNSTVAINLQKLRLVCKDWKKAIDKTVHVRIGIDDEHVDLPSMSHLQVSSCNVTRLCRQLPENHRLFQTLSKQLFVIGDITVDNFRKLIECANKLEHLYLSESPLQTANLMTTLCNNLSYRGFWNNLSKLAVEMGIFIDEESEIMRKNMICLMGCRMNNLKSLSLKIYNVGKDSCVAIINSVIGFLANHPKLMGLDVLMRCPGREGNPKPLDDNLKEKLAQVKLQSLTVAINSSYWRAWRRMINSLKTLKTLEFFLLDVHILNCRLIPENFPTNPLKEVLENNKDTLTSIGLDIDCIPSPVNAEVFNGMLNLKRLVLCNCDNNEKEIVNLKLLPASIECLELHQLTGESDDILEMKSRLKNIQRIRLVGFGEEHDVFEDIKQCRGSVKKDNFHDFFNGLDPFDETHAGLCGFRFCKLTLNSF